MCIALDKKERGFMPNSDVIADVSSTIENILKIGLSSLNPFADAVMHDLQGVIPTNPARLTIFLFEVTEDSSLKNRDYKREIQPNGYIFKKPPMALMLKFLLTPWSGDRITDHKILGRTLQVFYDNAILSGPQLQGNLAASDQVLKLKLATLTLEERTRVWHAVQKPYRLSVTYEVRVVNLDAEKTVQSTPITEGNMDYGVRRNAL